MPTTAEIYTLSLHDALPIYCTPLFFSAKRRSPSSSEVWLTSMATRSPVSEATNRRLPSLSMRSEEHTSELQSQSNLVCRLLLEKKKRRPRSRLVLKSGAHRTEVFVRVCRRLPRSTLFPYTTLFRSTALPCSSARSGAAPLPRRSG